MNLERGRDRKKDGGHFDSFLLVFGVVRGGPETFGPRLDKWGLAWPVYSVQPVLSYLAEGQYLRDTLYNVLARL